MDYASAKVSAELLRALYKFKIIPFEQLDKTVDKLQILVFQSETIAP